jgi:hypothetical protein
MTDMTDTPIDARVQQLTEDAVGQAFAAWAGQHPTLAGVINRLAVVETTVASLRESPAYRQAVEDYTQARVEIDFLGQVVALAGPILVGLLAAG